MEWQPIETAPKDGTRVLIADAKNVETGQWSPAYYSGTGYFVDYDEGWDDDRYDAAQRFYRNGPQPTHWMPLPAAPVAECA